MRFLRNAAVVTLLLIIASSVLYAADSAKTLEIIKGPYLQSVSQNEITVMWETNAASTLWVALISESKLSGSIVRHADDLQKVHRIRITGLTSGQGYRYRIKSELEGNRVESEGEFSTLPASGPFQFVAYGDTRTHPENHRKVIDILTIK